MAARQAPAPTRPWAGALAAVGFAAAFFWWWPTDLVADDAGIVVRYMDNFARGGFYSYNLSDGPVFGVSSFLHGALAGAFAWSRLLSPLHALFASNFVGLVLLGACLYEVLRRFSASLPLTLAAWLALLLAAPNLVIFYRQGLETPLQLGLLLLALAAYLHRRPRLLWAACALALIAKLDSLPAVAVLLAAAWARELPAAARRPALANFARQALLLFALPVGVWVLFCVAVFGSALPQSAYAKLFFATHPGGSWFPFLSRMLLDGASRLLMALFAAALAALVVAALARRRPGELADTAVVGLIWLAHMALYYFYNPGEQHPWYYAIPELLLRLQIVIAILVLGALLPRLRLVAQLAALAGLALLTWPQTQAHVALTVHLLEVVEGERIAGGRWLRAASAPDDRLLTAFGHWAREAGLYTYDYSGLNSRIATDLYARDRYRMLAELRPEWQVGHGLLGREAEAAYGYQLRHSLYNVTTIGLPAWRIYQRVPAAEVALSAPVPAEQITAAAVAAGPTLAATGPRVELRRGDAAACPVELALGLRHGPVPARVTLELLGPDGATARRATLELPGYVPRLPVGSFTSPWELRLDPARPVERAIVTATDGAGRPLEVTVIDPLFLERPCP